MGLDRARISAVAGSRRRGVFGILLYALCQSIPVEAADRIYWTNAAGGGASTVSFANLDGSGGGNLDTSGATADCCAGGVAIDAAAGRIYWASDANVIAFANLDGGGGGDLSTTGATVDAPDGIAIDPLGGRIYWANRQGNKISFANLDGSGGGDLSTLGATILAPQGVALDLAAGRIYWASNTFAISFANLNGSIGGDLDTTGATASRVQGVAIAAAAGRIYWSNFVVEDKISSAALDGGGGSDLGTTGATVLSPYGVAIDEPAGLIYWANYGGDSISFARLDGSGGADLDTTGATLSAPNQPALLRAPIGAGLPAITGDPMSGSVLSCSEGSWAPDLLGAALYRVPERFAHQWSLDGADIGGAAGSTHTPAAAGEYRCRVTASNAAGAASQTSDPLVVSASPQAALVPGGPTRKTSSDCYLELLVQGAAENGARILKSRTLECMDGTACDADGVCDNVCTLRVEVCVNQTDPRLPDCRPPTGLVTAAISGGVVLAVPPSLTGSTCAALATVPVEAKFDRRSQYKPRRSRLRMKGTAMAPKGTTPRTDRDSWTFQCVPNPSPGACPSEP